MRNTRLQFDNLYSIGFDTSVIREGLHARVNWMELLKRSLTEIKLYSGADSIVRDSKSATLIYSLPKGGLTDGFDPVTKAGAVSTATISKTGNYDTVVVGAGTQTSYFYVRKQFASTRNVVRLKVKVNSVGAAPVIGFNNIWPGAGYNQFNNTSYYAYVNLLTGVVTDAGSGDTVTTYNGFDGAVAAGDIVEIELITYYADFRLFRVTKVNSLTGEFSLKKNQKVVDAIDSKLQNHIYNGVVLADGSYTILDFSVTSLEPTNAKLMLVGDSMSVSVRQTYKNTIVGFLKSKSPESFAVVGGTSMEQRGLNAVLDEILKLRPEYVAVFNWINPIYQGDVNAADSNYATWNAAIQKFAQAIKTAGIKPIWMYPEKWALLDPDGVNAAVYETYLNTNFPNDLKIKLYASEVGYDSTGFHYDAATNELIADRLLTLLASQNAI